MGVGSGSAPDSWVPRQNLEAEQSVLGAMMLSHEAAALACATLRAEMFYREVHGGIYAAIADMVSRGEPCDLITLSQELSRRGNLDGYGGQAYLMMLANSVPSAANADRYAAIVLDAYRARQAMAVARQLMEMAADEGMDAGAIWDRHIAACDGILKASGQSVMRDVREVTRALFDRLEAASRGEVPRRHPTGFAELDASIGGMSPGQITVIGGRPKCGKTSLALQMIGHQARDVRVGITSMEMPDEDVVAVMVAQRSGVPVQKVRCAGATPPTWDGDEFGRVLDALDELSERVWAIGGPGVNDVDALIGVARRRNLTHGLDIWVVDHGHLLRADARGRQGRTHELEYCVRRLGEFARSTMAHVILLAQCTKPQGTEAPSCDEIKDTNAFVEEASNVIMVQPRKTEAGRSTWIALERSRVGPPASVECRFIGATQRFVPLMRGQCGVGEPALSEVADQVDVYS